MYGTSITELSHQQIHDSNNLSLTCISEAGGWWWSGSISTGQIMSSQPDMDRWRQRLVLPPALGYTHMRLATIFSRDNYLTTSASPHTHAHEQTHTQTHLANYQHTKGMITVTLEPLTQPVMVWTYTLYSPSSSIKYGKQLRLWRAQQPSVAVEHRQQVARQTVQFLKILFYFAAYCETK